jgi:preprotein translocase subunit Sec61beta
MAARSWIRSCLAIGVAAVCLAAWLAYDLNASHERLLRRVQAATKEDAARAAGEIDQNLRQASAALDALTSDLSAGRLSAEALGARLEAILEADPELLGVGVAYAPLGSRALYAPYHTRWGGKSQALHLEDSIRAGVPWYRDALRGGADWREPTWDEVEDSNTATYSAPFFGSDDTTPIGVALVSISIDRVRDRVDELDTGAAGWGVILSRETTFLAHPDEQRVEDRVKVKDLVGSDPNEVLPKLKRAAERGESVFFENIEETTGRNAWFFLEPVPATGWTLGLVRLEDEVVVEGRTHRRRVIRAGLVAILGLLLLGVPATAAAHARLPGLAALWGVAAWSSLLMIAGIEVIRSATYDQVSDEQRKTAVVSDEDGLQAFVASQRALWRKRHEAPPVPIRTGLLVRSLAFRSPKEVFVTGVLWQKFDDGRHDAVPRGVDLPDAVEADLEEVYRRRRGDGETVGWRFQATLRQVMDVSRYPLDHDNVSIRLLPMGLDSRVTLIPDLISYTSLTPGARPGLEEALELSGWDITGSFFDYKYASYNTDLGIPDYEGEESLPELHFNIELKRELLDAAIANGIPLLVVLMMLFAVVLTRTSDQEESKLFGFNPSGVVRICAALFFVVLLAHIQLRNELQAQKIVFLEYSYFLVYLALLLTALHTFLFFKSGVDFRLVQYRDGLILKLAYWPLLFALQLLAAIAIFY